MPVTKALLNNALSGHMDGICLGFSIAPGGQRDFHILLNDYFPDPHAGALSGSVIIPMIGAGSTGSFALVAPFKVNVAPPLTAAQMQPVCDAFGKRIIASAPDDQEIIHSDNALPDEYAVPMLLRIIKEKPPLPSAIDCLGQRARTPEREKALQSLAESSNPDVMRIASSYLSK